MARNKFIGSFRETPFTPVSLPFNVPSLRQLLRYGASPTAPYTHQQICDWTQRFSLALREEVDDLEQTPGLGIAEDVGAQWDMFLYNTYPLVQLQAMDFATVVLPCQWFQEWLQRLELASA